MTIAHSPLRYPGGKQILGRLLAHLVHRNGAAGGVYVEPYAGGAGVALALLFGEHVNRVVINDADVCIFAFWNSLLSETDKFIKLLYTTPVTVQEWTRQRKIYRHPAQHSKLRVGFATFYLNRCNRSGIIMNGGPIGGQKQIGKWKIDARFNRTELERRIRRIALYRDRITVFNLDAIELLRSQVSVLEKKECPFVYLDPPYYAKGRDLYLNYYEHDDHARLASHMRGQDKFPWVMSYDNVPQISALYKELRQIRFGLDYTARERHTGTELMIFPPSLAFPRQWVRSIPARYISAADHAPAFPEN